MSDYCNATENIIEKTIEKINNSFEESLQIALGFETEQMTLL